MKRTSPFFYIIVIIEVIIAVILIAFLVKKIAKNNSAGNDHTITSSLEPTATQKLTSTVVLTPTLEPTVTPKPTAEPTLPPTPTPTIEPTSTPTPTPTPTPVPRADNEGREAPAGGTLFGYGDGKVICIDPGHQIKGNYNTEPVGPGASEKKAKVSSGTQGKTTRLPEYKLNLTVAFLLKDELLERGYRVIMTRTVNEIDISNIERATIANENHVDAFVRIHANAAESSAVSGIETICQTPGNKYNGDIYRECRNLSDYVLDCIAESTGGKKRHVWETDTMSGINWSKVPVTIVEMGYMTNPEEDVLLSDPEYQKKIVKGIADGIDMFFLDN